MGRQNSDQSDQSDQAKESPGDPLDASKNGIVHSKTYSVQSGNGGGKPDASSEAPDASPKVASKIKSDNNAVLDGIDALDATLHTLPGEANEEDDILAGRVL